MKWAREYRRRRMLRCALRVRCRVCRARVSGCSWCGPDGGGR